MKGGTGSGDDMSRFTMIVLGTLFTLFFGSVWLVSAFSSASTVIKAGILLVFPLIAVARLAAAFFCQECSECHASLYFRKCRDCSGFRFHFVPLAECGELKPGEYIVESRGNGGRSMGPLSWDGNKWAIPQYPDVSSVLHHGSVPVVTPEVE